MIMGKFMLLWCFAMVLVINSSAQNLNTINIDQYEIVLEFSGKIENQLDSVFNIVTYLSISELDEIEKVIIKRTHQNEEIDIEKIHPRKERKRTSSESEKQKIILATHSASNPFLGINFFDKKGRKINN